jgi:hypothetical protein
VHRRSKDAVSPHFDCTRHNVRREWLKWRDLGASGQAQEWIRHGVAVPWLTRSHPPHSIKAFRVAGFPTIKQCFYKRETVRLILSAALCHYSIRVGSLTHFSSRSQPAPMVSMALGNKTIKGFKA